MCGITGFTGAEAALPFIVEGLEKLEYRGYDSAGVTLVDKNDLFTCKVSGRLDKLKAKLEKEVHQQTIPDGLPMAYLLSSIHIRIQTAAKRSHWFIMVSLKTICR